VPVAHDIVAGDRQVGRRLADAHAADRVDEHVLVQAGDAGVAVQHREQLARRLVSAPPHAGLAK
jgi:hypothetical protein